MTLYLKVIVVCALMLISCAQSFGVEAVVPFDVDKAKQASMIQDPEAATKAYLDAVPLERRNKTKSYARGNYILDILAFAFDALLLFLILYFGISARMRDRAQSWIRFRPLQNASYWIQLLLLMTVLSFPLVLYRSYFREKSYGLLIQNFGGWLTDQAIGLLLGIVLGSLIVMVLYGVFRVASRTWWIWGSAVMIFFVIFSIALAPVFIMPLFNKFTPIQNAALRESILTMAHEQGIPANEVYEMDASQRTDRISAFVNGMLGTMRIVMFDNTLKRCTPAEIQMIMGHEMGHYVLNHVWKGVAFFSVLILLSFLFVRWAFAKAIQKWPTMRINSISDVAGLPLLWLLLSLVLFVSSPVTNSWTRMIEDDADDFGLSASHQPDGAATTFLKLGEYRDLDPHPVVEFLFFDHPSGRSRILNAMKWKANQRQAGLVQ